MLKHIKLEGYKSFDLMQLSLGQLAVLIGPNAAGKSNFLDALYLLSRFVTSPNLNEAYKEHRGLPLESMWYGDRGFDELRQRESVRCSFEVSVELSQQTIDETEEIVRQKRHGLDGHKEAKRRIVGERLLRYSLCVELVPKTGVLRVVDEELRALTGELAPKPDSQRRAFLEKDGDGLILRMEAKGHPTKFPIGLDHTVVSTSLYEPHYPHITAFRLELRKWHVYYLEPRVLMREEVPVSDKRSMGPRGEEFAALLNSWKALNPGGFDNFRRTVKAILPSQPEIDVTLGKEGTVGLEVTESGLPFSGRLISEGTLRALGLVAAIRPENPGTLVGYEEPENGVHPVRIRTFADMLKNATTQYGKQLIATTHSPLFASRFDAGCLYVCRKSGTRSIIEPLKEAGPLFDEADVERALAEAFQRGDFGG